MDCYSEKTNKDVNFRSLVFVCLVGWLVGWLCHIIILDEPFLNQMWPRHSVSYSCQEYVSNEIAESIRDLMLVSIKV